MFDRQFFPTLRVSAAVEGAIAPRPASPLFAEARAGQVVEPLVKPPGAPEHELGSGSGGAPPDDGDGRRGRPAVSRDAVVAAQDEGVGMEAGSAGAPTEQRATDIASATDDATATGTEPAAEEGTAPDLTGYGAYGNVPAPGSGLSRSTW